MDSGLRKTGISVVGDMPWGTHFCHFYETKQDLLDTLVPYFKAGLEIREFCLWVVSDSDLIAVEEAKGALAQAVPELDRHLAEENIEILKRHDWYFEEHALNLERAMQGWDSKLKRALTRGYEGLRASADTFWLAEKDWKDFFDYEKQVNDWITDRPMTVMCTYPLAKSGAAEVLDVVHAHQAATARRQGEWEVIEAPDLTLAKAEIKRLNKELEQRVEEQTKELRATNEELKKEIVERKRAQERNLKMLDAIPQQVWSGPADGTLDYCNDQWRAFMGLALEELQVDGWQQMLHAEDKDRVLKVWSESVATGRPYEQEERHRRVDGAYRWFLCRGLPLRGADGRIERWYGTNTDIEDRKQAEALLYAKEREFRAIVEDAPDLIIRYDRDFRRTYVNPALANAYGLSAEALIGKPIGSGFQDTGLEVNEDELRWLRQRIAAVFETGESSEFEITLPLPTGRKYFSIRVFPELDLNGSVINVLGIARDITERRDAEQSLRLFRALIDQTSDAIEVIDPDTLRFLDCNTCAYQSLGYTREEFLDLNIFDIDPLVTDDLNERVNKEIARSGFTMFESIHRRKDGSTFPVEVSLTVVSLERDYRLAVVRDITERKRAEDALRRSEDRLRLAIDTIPTMVWSLRPDGVVDFLNKRWRDYTGLSLEQFIEDSTRPIHPEDIPKAEERWRSKAAAGEPYDEELRLQGADREYRWFLVRTAPLRDELGNIVKWYGVSVDIEERKQAEEKLQKSESELAEAQRMAHVGSWNWSIKDSNLTWSDELYSIFGLDPRESHPSYEAYLERIHPEDRDVVIRNVESSLKTLAPFSHSARIVRPDGEVRILQSRGSVVSDEHRNPVRLFGTCQDVTELKHAEDRLNTTSEQLRALSARVQSAREDEGTRIAREIHDELGSALTSLRWDLESFDKVILESGGQSGLGMLREKIEGMLSLIESAVGTVRRISSELRPTVLDDLGLAAAIEWQTEQFQARTGIVCQYDCSLEDLVLSQEKSTAVFRIFQEALTNILRHAQATSVDVSIKAEVGEFILTINDNGRGITEDERTRSHSLGILGMQERAHLIGGSIVISGAEGKGTVITLRIPILEG